MTFGEKLKEARKESGLSQEQLSEKMSVSRSAIAKWETDKGMPDVNNLKVIAQLLNVSVDDLLDDEEKICFHEMKEAIHLDNYEKTGKCREKYVDNLYYHGSTCSVKKIRNKLNFFADNHIIEKRHERWLLC